MLKKKIVKSWWFQLLGLPILVGLILLVVQKSCDKGATDNSHNFNAEQTMTVQGDFVQGDKNVVVSQNTTVFRKFDKQHMTLFRSKLDQLRRATPSVPLKILLNYYSQDEGTKMFVTQLEKMFSESSVEFSAVPIVMVGGPQPTEAVVIGLGSLEDGQRQNILGLFDLLFSRKNEPGQIVYGNSRLQNGYNVVVVFKKQVHFDEEGRVYFLLIES